jgi:hypothetical protein
VTDTYEASLERIRPEKLLAPDFWGNDIWQYSNNDPEGPIGLVVVDSELNPAAGVIHMRADQAIRVGEALISAGTQKRELGGTPAPAKENEILNEDSGDYADARLEAINETYKDPESDNWIWDDLLDGESFHDAERRILTKAANCLRNGVPTTFTAGELDLVRHMMPAHEVHQSGAVRWVLEVYGDDDGAVPIT